MVTASLLILLVTLYRIFLAPHGGSNDWISNFSPLASIVLCGTVVFPKRIALIIPLAVLLISDWILNTFVYHESLWTMEIFPRYVAFAMVGGMALWIRKQQKSRAPMLFGGAVAGAVIFYLVTNTASWIGNAAYAQNFAGWLQALTWGEPGFSPTWIFFRNSLVSDLLFTVLFLVCIPMSRRQQTPAELVPASATLVPHRVTP